MRRLRGADSDALGALSASRNSARACLRRLWLRTHCPRPLSRAYSRPTRLRTRTRARTRHLWRRVRACAHLHRVRARARRRRRRHARTRAPSHVVAVGDGREQSCLCRLTPTGCCFQLSATPARRACLLCSAFAAL
eukprot:3026249-Pleurochrysis_carterae.AAC.1